MQRMSRLYHPPPPVHDPDPARDHAGVVRGGAVRARRAGRARDRATLRRRHRRDLAHLGFRPAATSARAARSQGGAQIDAVTSKYRGAQGLDPEFIKKPGEAVRLRQAGLRALFPDAVELSPPSTSARAISATYQRAPTHQGEAAGLDVARHLDDAADLSDLDPARHPQGGDATARASTSGPRASSSSATRFPGFLFAILLIILFAGGSFFDWFPLRGLTSDNWAQLSVVAEDRRLFLAPDAADHRRWGSAPSPP